MDIELLARADYFVGSWNSGMAVLVDALRYGLHGKDRCTSLDASSARLDFCSRIRDFFLRPGPEDWALRRRARRRMLEGAQMPLAAGGARAAPSLQ